MPTLLLDQAHKNFFGIQPGAPRSMAGLQQLAINLGYTVLIWETETEPPRLEPTALDGVALVILPVPTEPYDQTTLAALTDYGRRGGNLLLLQEEGSDRNWGNNLSELAGQAGLRFGNYFWSGRNEVQVIPKHLLGIVPGVNDGVISLSLKGTCDVEILPQASEAEALAFLPDREEHLRPVAARVRLGQGWLYAFGDCSLFSEGALKDQHNPTHARGNRRLLENILRLCATAEPEIAASPELILARNLEGEAEQAEDLLSRAALYEKAAQAYLAAGSPASQERYALFAQVLRHPRLGKLLQIWYPKVGREEMLLQDFTDHAILEELVGRGRSGLTASDDRPWVGMLATLSYGAILIGVLFYFVPLNLVAVTQVLSSLLQGLLGVLAIGFVGLQLRDQLRQEAGGVSRFLAGDAAFLEEAARLYHEPKTLLCLLYVKYLTQLNPAYKGRMNLRRLDVLLQKLWQAQASAQASSQTQTLTVGREPRQLELARIITTAWDAFKVVELDVNRSGQLTGGEATAPLLPAFYMPFAQVSGRLKEIAEDITKGISKRELENRISGQLVLIMAILAATILLIMVLMPLLTEANVNEPISHIVYSSVMGLVFMIVGWLFLYIRLLVRRE